MLGPNTSPTSVPAWRAPQQRLPQPRLVHARFAQPARSMQARVAEGELLSGPAETVISFMQLSNLECGPTAAGRSLGVDETGGRLGEGGVRTTTLRRRPVFLSTLLRP